MGRVTVVATWPFSQPAVAAVGHQIAIEQAEVCSALVAGANLLEEDPSVGPYFVGVGGMPTDEGVIECDAAVMRGKDCAFGAVAALSDIATPASVAHDLMLKKNTTHSMLVGDGALRYAKELGYTKCEMLTPGGKAAFEVHHKIVQ